MMVKMGATESTTAWTNVDLIKREWFACQVLPKCWRCQDWVDLFIYFNHLHSPPKTWLDPFEFVTCLKSFIDNLKSLRKWKMRYRQFCFIFLFNITRLPGSLPFIFDSSRPSIVSSIPRTIFWQSTCGLLTADCLNFFGKSICQHLHCHCWQTAF